MTHAADCRIYSDDIWESRYCDCGFANMIIELPDGYSGNTAKFYAEPIAVDGDLVKLRCAEPGKHYLIRWVRKSDLTQPCNETP